MKSILTLITLVFTMMFSSTSFADWTEVSKTIRNDTFYVDFTRIKKYDGYIYFWTLGDYEIRSEQGTASVINYNKGDCTLFRMKNLNQRLFRGQMGQDRLGEITEEDKDWTYPPPNSVRETLLATVCSR